MRMKGKLLVDGVDVFEKYGIFVEQYGYKALMQEPSFKKISSTEWPEYDGEEVDLISPVLDAKSFSIQFCITDKYYAEDFFYMLSENGSYHIFDFVDLKRSYKLRMTSNGSFSSNILLGKLSLSFSQDDCKVSEVDLNNVSIPKVKQSGYEIDGIELSTLGIFVLNGTDDNIRKSPNVRDNLTVSAQNISGVIYDDKNVLFKAKDVTLSLLINSSDIDIFWRSWNALFSILMKPELRTFSFGANAKDYECYYKSNRVSKFDIIYNGHVWCEFSVTMTFINDRPSEHDISLLSTELSELVVTEDSQEYYINLNRYANS